MLVRRAVSDCNLSPLAVLVEVWSPDVEVKRGLRETDGQLGMECVCTDSRLNSFPCSLSALELSGPPGTATSVTHKY